MNSANAAHTVIPLSALAAVALMMSACGSNRTVTLDSSMGLDQEGDSAAARDAAGGDTVRDTSSEGAVEDGWMDAPPTDTQVEGHTADLPGVDGPAVIASDTCAKAMALPWIGGQATTSGSTDYATDTVNLSSSGCTSDVTEGPDVFYKVNVIKGKVYSAVVTPASGYNAAIYILSGCTNPATACIGGADANYSGDAETVVFTAPATGMVTVVIDSSWASSSSYAYGAFTLTVQELVPPANDSCNKAKPLVIGTSGPLIVKGTTLGANNDVKLPSSGCTGNITAGPDVFYEVALSAGKVYNFKLSATGGWNASLYAFTSCSSPSSTCGAGMGADDWSLSDEDLSLNPAVNGTYTIAVSGRGGGDAGSYTLTISEVGVGPGSCTKAKALTFSGSKATIKSSNFKTGSSVNLSSSGCTGDVTPGGDVFFKLGLTAGTTYVFSVKPESGFNAAAYLLSACSPATCVAGADLQYAGDTETFTYTPTTSGTYTVGVDSRYSSSTTYSEGTFTLTVEKIAPLTNNICTKATSLALSGGTVSIKGHNIGSTNTVTLPASGCIPSVDTNGGDVFYKVALTAGKSYLVSIYPSSGFDPSIYIFSSCSSPAGSCLAGKDTGSTGEVDSFIFTPATSGTYLVGVDSDYSLAHTESTGTFTLSVDEAVTPTHDTCLKAKPLTLSSAGGVTVSDNSILATSTVALTSSGCTGDTTAGPDLFYAVQLSAGTTYTITLTPNDSTWDPALYVFTSCSSPSSTCKSGWGSDIIGKGTAESVTVTPAASGTFIIAVDSFYTSKSGVGKFTLTVK